VNGSAFDPNDGANSLLWLTSSLRRIDKSKESGNEMVEKSKDERRKELIDSLEGKKVRWPADVISIDSNGFVSVQLPAVGLSEEQAKFEFPHPDDNFGYAFIWEPKFPITQGKDRGWRDASGAVTSPDKEWLETLVKGDKLVLTGPIKKVKCRHFNDEEYAPPKRGHFERTEFWEIHFEDAAVEPMK